MSRVINPGERVSLDMLRAGIETNRTSKNPVRYKMVDGEIRFEVDRGSGWEYVAGISPYDLYRCMNEDSAEDTVWTVVI